MYRGNASIRWAMLITALSTASLSADVGPFTIPIDELLSSVTVEICIPGGCDSDVSPVSGFYDISLDTNIDPANIELHDFDVLLTEPIDINISVFLGGLTATGQNIRMLYAIPGTPFGPTPINAGGFAFVGVPTFSEGTVAYNATGTVCVALQASGVPCVDTRNLAEQGGQAGDIDGTIVIENGVATLTFTPNVEVPLDPANPSLGTLTISGTVVGSVPVPDAVPTVASWGLAMLACLLLTAGSVVIRRRSRCHTALN